MSSSGWGNFWTNQGKSFDSVMKISTVFFAQEMQKQFHLKTTHKILDYGCGPGFLIDYFAAKKIPIMGADINKFYLNQCKKNHPQSLFLTITTDVGTNQKILNEYLEKDSLDFIVILSISQYFESARELEKVIEMLCPHLSKHGKIILADLIGPNTSSIKDALALFSHCISKGRLLAFFKFIVYLMLSDYRRISRNVKLLRVSEQSMHQIARNNSLNCEKVNGLTIHSSRNNYILSREE